MNTANVFYPSRRNGALFQSGAVALFALISAWLIWQAGNAEIGPAFIFYLLPGLFSFGLVPVLIYRIQSLLVAEYRLERDGIRLRWGLRYEDIPMDALVWVKAAQELDQSPPLPWFRWPGSVLGVRKMPSGTPVEYLAGDATSLVFVATRERVFALSPENPKEFLERFHTLFELGSLLPFAARSVYPMFLFARVWRVRAPRYLIVAGLLANVFLLLWVSLASSTRSQILLGFTPGGVPVPSIRLLLLPLISGFFYLADLLTGLYFYRHVGRPVQEDETGLPEGQSNASPKTLEPIFAYILWGSGVLSTLLFILAVFFILNSPASF